MNTTSSINNGGSDPFNINKTTSNFYAQSNEPPHLNKNNKKVIILTSNSTNLSDKTNGDEIGNSNRKKSKKPTSQIKKLFESNGPILEAEEQENFDNYDNGDVILRSSSDKKSTTRKSNKKKKILDEQEFKREEEVEQRKIKNKAQNKTTNKSTSKKMNNQDRVIIDSEAEDYYDLYNTAPTILYLKQKYKMYLDWLSQNCAQNTTNLNWYNYEISLNSNEKEYLKKCLENLNSNNQNSNKEKYRTFSKPPVVVTQSTFTQSNTNKKNSPTNMSLPNLNNSTKFTNSQSPDSSSYSPTLQINNLKKLPQIINTTSTSTTKGVKFEVRGGDGGAPVQSSNHVPNSYVNNNNHINKSRDYANLSPQLMKPILKQQNINCMSGAAQPIADSNLVSMHRKSSFGSTGSSQYSSNMNNLTAAAHNNILNNSIRASTSTITSLSSVKLPPIARCSDDFYAVLNDLGKENSK